MDIEQIQQGTNQTSELVKNEDKKKDKEKWQPNADEMVYFNLWKNRIEHVRKQYDSTHEEFDDMTYENDYWLNRRAAVSYLRKKINDDEVRIVGGTTEKKIEFVYNELLSLNLQPEIASFDKQDIQIVKLGEAMEDIVRRTNEMENDEDLYVDAYLELLTQRAVFIEEIQSYKRDDVHGLIKKCEKRIIPGLQVLLANWKIPSHRLNDQPYILKYERKMYDEAEAIYGKWKNWKYVSPGIVSTADGVGSTMYRQDTIQDSEVEILHCMDGKTREYQIYINSVQMLPIGTKMPWNYEGYNLTMTILKPIASNFAYGKPLTASAKTLQALDDETFRNLVRKFRQAIEPPTGVKAGKVYSRDIWNAGSMVQGAMATDFSKLIDHTGVTTSEMEMLKYIENKVSEFIGTISPLPQSGSKGTPTATEIITNQKAIIKMLGLAVLACMRMKRNLTFLRIYNSIETFSEPVGTMIDPETNQMMNVYQKFTLNNASFPSGKSGTKIIQLSAKDMTPEDKRQVWEHERAMSHKNGVEYQITSVNIEKLAAIKVYWYVNIVQKERDSSELSKAQNNDMLIQAGNVQKLTGRPLNPDKVVDRFETIWKSKDLFQKNAPTPPPVGNEMQGNSQLSEQIKNGPLEAAQTPSLNTLVK